MLRLGVLRQSSPDHAVLTWNAFIYTAFARKNLLNFRKYADSLMEEPDCHSAYFAGSVQLGVTPRIRDDTHGH
jgi:hypothetical protein